MRQPTLTDVARHAGVSYATADRVLNGRAPVSERSTERVRAAVADLGYVRNIAAANLSRRRSYHFVVALPSGANAFFQRMRDLIRARMAAMAAASVRLDMREVPAFDAPGLAAFLHDLAEETPDGIAVVGLDGPELAVPLGELRRRGVAIVSLVSPLAGAGGADYVGIDNDVAGRSAARLTGFSHGRRAGVVQPVVGALNARDHSQRLAGFRAVLARDFPGLDVLPVIEGRDTADMVEAAIGARLAERPDITAIYNAGAGNAGLARALGARRARPFCIVHELVAHSRAALEDNVFDVVIDQRPELEIAAALRLLRRMSDGLDAPAEPPICPTILVRDNLPKETAETGDDA